MARQGRLWHDDRGSSRGPRNQGRARLGQACVPTGTRSPVTRGASCMVSFTERKVLQVRPRCSGVSAPFPRPSSLDCVRGPRLCTAQQLVAVRVFVQASAFCFSWVGTCTGSRSWGRCGRSCWKPCQVACQRGGTILQPNSHCIRGPRQHLRDWDFDSAILGVVRRHLHTPPAPPWGRASFHVPFTGFVECLLGTLFSLSSCL